MWSYWRKVGKIAFKKAAELVGFGSAERAVVTVSVQAAIALLIYLMLGATELHDNAVMRLITATAPMAVFPLIYLWKMLSVPAELHTQRLREEDNERWGHVFYLSDMYVRQEQPENAHLIQRHLAYPPEDWLNAKLEELEFDWRVKIHPGAKFTTYDAH